MSDELKSFPPSELKLQRLRSDGVIPFSTEVLAFGTVLGLVVGCSIFTLVYGTSLLQYARDAFSASASESYFLGEALRDDVSSHLMLTFEVLRGAVLSILIPIVFFVLLLGFLQSRFLLAFGLLRLNVSALFSGLASLFSGYLARWMLSAASVLKFSALLLVAVLFLRYLIDGSFVGFSFDSYLIFKGEGAQGGEQGVLEQSGSLPRLSAAEVTEALSTSFDSRHQYFLCILVLSFLIGVASYFLIWLSFQRRHRMSRNEVEEESREMEMAEDARRARSEFRYDITTE